MALALPLPFQLPPPNNPQPHHCPCLQDQTMRARPRQHPNTEDPEPDYPHQPTELLRGGRVVWLGNTAKTQCWRGRAALEVCNCITHFVTHFSYTPDDDRRGSRQTVSVGPPVRMDRCVDRHTALLTVMRDRTGRAAGDGLGAHTGGATRTPGSLTRRSPRTGDRRGGHRSRRSLARQQVHDRHNATASGPSPPRPAATPRTRSCVAPRAPLLEPHQAIAQRRPPTSLVSRDENGTLSTKPGSTGAAKTGPAVSTRAPS